MPRLLRPTIPTETKCRVALRQLGEMWPDRVIETAKAHRALGRQLEGSLKMLADLLGCEIGELHLDHNPALATRDKVFRKGEHIGYKPDANDPEFLLYRTKAAHRIKTNVRGDGALHPDRVYIKRARRRERAANPAGKPTQRLKWRGGGKSKGKPQSTSRWPQGRKLPSRPFPAAKQHFTPRRPL